MAWNDIKFEYYAVRVDFNTKKVNQFNIFDNTYVYNGALKAVVQYMTGVIKYDEYVKELRSVIMHEMWSRVQYEISVGEAFEENAKNLHKIDVFYQIEKNLPVIAMYVYQTAKDYFYNEDVMNTEIKPEALRDHIWVDEAKNETFQTRDKAIAAITDDDLDETDGDRMKYENWFIKEYVSKY